MSAANGRFEPRYSDDEKRAALELGARVGRSAAVRQLGISKSAFQHWTEAFPEFWSDLKAGMPRHEAKTRVASNLEDLADAYTALEFQALERTEKLLKTSDPKETAALIKAMGSSRSVATVGARGYRGEDHEVIEHTINFPALEQAAEALLAKATPVHVLNEAEAETVDDG